MEKARLINLTSWMFTLLVFVSAYLISVFEGLNYGFLALLFLNLVLAVYISGKMDSGIVRTIARISVGILFIYSGFVKGVDPLGTQFRIEDYFYAYGTLWALPLALPLSILLNAFEFSLGLLLVLNIRMKLISWLAFLVMILFTFTTLNDALYSPVPDCGCFGDALIISNWQTFYKNLVIMSFIILILRQNKFFKNRLRIATQYAVIALVFIGFALFEINSIRHLPVLDFRPWKVGNRLLPENPRPAKFYFTYKNNSTGEEKEYLSSELPWQDTLFLAQWSFVSSREINPDAALYRTFPMLDADGNDMSQTLVSLETPTFFMVVYDVKHANADALKKFDAIYDLCLEKGWEFYLLNSDVPEELADVKAKLNLADYPVLNSDDTSLKAAIRANPGLIVVKKSVVLAKFNHRDIPNLEELMKIAE